MLNFDNIEMAAFPADTGPVLHVVVDTEEEFDWNADFSRDATSINSMEDQYRAQEIYEPYGVKPTYVIDYSVASQKAGIDTLKSLFDEDKCDIGAHLHTWVTPPFDETVCAENTFQGNLPAELEAKKTTALTEEITKNFGFSPKIFKAGRYGVGDNTAKIIHDLGYELDCSVLPNTNLNSIHGPDFWNSPEEPYWFGPNKSLLETPLTKSYVGVFQKISPELKNYLNNPVLNAIKFRRILSRLNFLDLLTLTPEGMKEKKIIKLLHSLNRRGHNVFSLTYHSSSLMVGGTPYAKTVEERDNLLKLISVVLKVFHNDIGGTFIKTIDIKRKIFSS